MCTLLLFTSLYIHVGYITRCVCFTFICIIHYIQTKLFQYYYREIVNIQARRPSETSNRWPQYDRKRFCGSSSKVRPRFLITLTLSSFLMLNFKRRSSLTLSIQRVDKLHYTGWCPSLRESWKSAECRDTNLFWVSIKRRTTTWRHRLVSHHGGQMLNCPLSVPKQCLKVSCYSKVLILC